MADKVFVYIDHYNGQAVGSSWEAVGEALKIGAALSSGVTALVVGDGVRGLAEEAITYGATQAIVLESAELKDFRPEPYADVVTGVLKQHQPAVLMMPTTGRTRELGAMVAVDLETGVTPDAIALEVDQGSVVATRPIYAGKLFTKEVARDRRPQIVMIRTRAFPRPSPDASKKGGRRGQCGCAAGARDPGPRLQGLRGRRQSDGCRRDRLRRSRRLEQRTPDPAGGDHG